MDLKGFSLIHIYSIERKERERTKMKNGKREREREREDMIITSGDSAACTMMYPAAS